MSKRGSEFTGPINRIFDPINRCNFVHIRTDVIPFHVKWPNKTADPLNSFAVMRNYIACTCVGAHLLGITRVRDTPYYVWLIAFTSDCYLRSCAQMLVLDCLRGFEHLTGCKWCHARCIRCRLQRCCLQRIHALMISDGKGGLDSITEATGYGDKFFSIYALTQR